MKTAHKVIGFLVDGCGTWLMLFVILAIMRYFETPFPSFEACLGMIALIFGVIFILLVIKAFISVAIKRRARSARSQIEERSDTDPSTRRTEAR